MKRRTPDTPVVETQNAPALSLAMAKQLVSIISIVRREMDESVLCKVLNAGLEKYGKTAIYKALHATAIKHGYHKDRITPGNSNSIRYVSDEALLSISTELEEYPNFLEESLIAASKTLRENRGDFISDLVFHAGREGRLDLVTYLTNIRYEDGTRLFYDYRDSQNRQVIDGAVINGHLSIVQYLFNLKDDNGKLFAHPPEQEQDADEAKYNNSMIGTFFMALENGRFRIARYLSTLPLASEQTLITQMEGEHEYFWTCYNNYSFSTLSMLSAFFKGQVPGGLKTEKYPSAGQILETYLKKEAELTTAAGLDSPQQVYELRDDALLIWPLRQEVIELACCIRLGIQNFPIDLLNLIEATYLGARPATTSHVVSLAKLFQVPTVQEIENTKVEVIERLSYESKRHIALLERAVAANNQLSKSA